MDFLYLQKTNNQKRMRKLLIVLALLSPFFAFAQNDDAKKLTKFEEFSSKTGTIVKFYDVSLPRLSTQFASLETGIRIIKTGSDSYFYRIEKPETSSSNARIAMIEYSDLVEINKALEKLASDVADDVSANPDYLENKFRTVDGFEVGYYVSKKEAHWFMKLERYTSSTVFFKNQDVIIEAFKAAQAKIDELKGQ